MFGIGRKAVVERKAAGCLLAGLTSAAVDQGLIGDLVLLQLPRFAIDQLRRGGTQLADASFRGPTEIKPAAR